LGAYPSAFHPGSIQCNLPGDPHEINKLVDHLQALALGIYPRPLLLLLTLRSLTGILLGHTDVSHVDEELIEQFQALSFGMDHHPIMRPLTPHALINDELDAL
jgi:hypothetical protein